MSPSESFIVSHPALLGRKPIRREQTGKRLVETIEVPGWLWRRQTTSKGGGAVSTCEELIRLDGLGRRVLLEGRHQGREHDYLHTWGYRGTSRTPCTLLMQVIRGERMGETSARAFTEKPIAGGDLVDRRFVEVGQHWVGEGEGRQLAEFTVHRIEWGNQDDTYWERSIWGAQYEVGHPTSFMTWGNRPYGYTSADPEFLLSRDSKDFLEAE